jgi:hypothetical protein
MNVCRLSSMVPYLPTMFINLLLAATADQDLVTRGGKLAVFKRPGHRVLLQQGDMLVSTARGSVQ